MRSIISPPLSVSYSLSLQVDKNWRSTLAAARGGGGANPQPVRAISFCANEKLLEKFQESNKFLDLVQKGLSDYLETKHELKGLKDTFVAVTTRVEAVDAYSHEVAERNHDLKETVAQLSGYLAGILPKAGVRVPGAEPGAINMEIVSDPLPMNEKRQRPVNVHTRVPAPK